MRKILISTIIISFIFTLNSSNLGFLPIDRAKASSSNSVQFGGYGDSYQDRIEIPISPSDPINVGAGDFAIEFWMKASSAYNQPYSSGPEWFNGNIIFDRDILDYTNDKFGISLHNGNLRFGAGMYATTIETSGVNVADDTWRFIVVNRRASDGYSQIYVDGALKAEGVTAAGDISYKSGYQYRSAESGLNRYCSYIENKNPYIVLGAEKHDYAYCTSGDPELARRNSYNGLLDDVRISNVLRTSTARPVTDLAVDSHTVGLYRFNEFITNGEGVITRVVDSSLSQKHGEVRDYVFFPAYSPFSPIYTNVRLELYGYNSGLFISTTDTYNSFVTNISLDNGDTWSGWQISNPGVAEVSLKSGGSTTFTEFNGTLYQVGRDQYGDVVMRTKTGDNFWSEWYSDPEGMYTIARVAMTVFNGRLYQAARRPDNAIATRFTSDGVNWSPWVDSGYTSNDISMTVFNSRLYQAVRGNSGMIFTRYTTDGINWTPWVGNGYTPGMVAMVVYNNRLYQAVRGNSGGIFTRYTTDGENWSAWQQNGATPGNVSMAVFNNKLYQVVRGKSSTIFTRYTSDGVNWSSWVGNGSTPYDVSILSSGSRLIQAAIGNSRRIFIRYSDDGYNWSGWQAI